jgi:hypothetical protein
LTFPDFDSKPTDTSSLKYAAYKARRLGWANFVEGVQSLQPIDILINCGDNIDGRGEASGGTELLLPKRTEQVDMAAEVIKSIKAKKIFMVRGTPYHVGKDDNYEDAIATAVKAEKIGDHDYISVNGLVFDYAHTVGGSALPNGRFAPLARERLLNLLWAEHDEFPKADVILRGHRHYHAYCGEPGWLAMTIPGLQSSSHFGRIQVRYTIHTGLVWFDVESKEDFTWDSIIWRLRNKMRELVVA